MTYTPAPARCTRCHFNYIGAVCNLCKLGRNGKDYA
jgi:hypothetical protein